eukprot:TRINITY_DN14384_c0_g2_i1.p1 TRINITY_DN14384_c0_g2~~TRINITY_DN14384_c0_g2_i1.p1  ORF type:complete len:674 (+),score=76.27 TRINITY_DN14384_c0_g2_i1:138-2024(+)
MAASAEPNKQCEATVDCQVLGSTLTDDLQECCDTCRNTTGCTVWTLNTKERPGICWLRTRRTAPVNREFCTTGHLDGEATPGPSPLAPRGAKNVLFFAIDDLRPELGLYGSSAVQSPHMDDLAKTSMVFERMYTAVAVCGPARTAILVGRRPDTTRNWKLDDAAEYWRNVLPDAASLPQYFKEHGYITLGQGKIFHPGALHGFNDVEHSWSPESLPYHIGRQRAAKSSIIGDHPDGWAIFDIDDDSLMIDGDIADHAAQSLQTLAARKEKRPFFMGVGFFKPHMPEECPIKYYDMYALEAVDLPANPAPPKGAPSVAVQPSKEHREWLNLDSAQGACVENFTAWTDPGQCRYADSVAKEMRRAYRACISFVDAQVGRVLQAVKDYGFYDSTVVVLFGDHGWHLGDLNMWAKYTNYEQATRMPFLMHLAGQTDGLRTAALVEANDIFPSVAEAAGLPAPPLCSSRDSQEAYCVEGVSTLPLWDAPDQVWKRAAFSQYPRPFSGFPSPQLDLPFPFRTGNKETVMGYATRENAFRYVEWVSFDHLSALPDWNIIYGRELYSHETSPVPDASFNYENVNLADSPEYAAIVKSMSERLRLGWREAMPPTKRALTGGFMARCEQNRFRLSHGG